MKKKFIEEPGQMKLLIVVDKLLTGFDAPPATYLYIDKQMRDHGLFQAICRVNRLDGEDKEYGYIIDYKDLFKSLEGRSRTTPPGRSMVTTRRTWRACWKIGWQRRKSGWRTRWRRCKALCEPVEAPKDSAAHTCATSAPRTSGNAEQLKDNEPSACRSTSWRHRWCAPTPTWRTRWPEAGYIPTEIDSDQGGSRALTKRSAMR